MNIKSAPKLLFLIFDKGALFLKFDSPSLYAFIVWKRTVCILLWSTEESKSYGFEM